MSSLRRYEILLPLRFNDGSLVPEELLALTLSELRERFRSVSWETQIVQGTWEHEGTAYRDHLTRLFVDVPDLPEHRTYFQGYKEVLKSRFHQLEIWITSHPIDVI